jgi:hypothetical protein
MASEATKPPPKTPDAEAETSEKLNRMFARAEKSEDPADVKGRKGVLKAQGQLANLKAGEGGRRRRTLRKKGALAVFNRRRRRSTRRK